MCTSLYVCVHIHLLACPNDQTSFTYMKDAPCSTCSTYGIFMYIFEDIHTYIYTRIIYIHTYTKHTHTHINTYTHTHRNICTHLIIVICIAHAELRLRIEVQIQIELLMRVDRLCVYVCMHVCMYASGSRFSLRLSF